MENWKSAGNRGLSIPFIVSSQNYLPENVERQTLAELIEEITDNSDITVFLTFCFHIKDLILEIGSPTPENPAALVRSSFVSDLGGTTE